MNVVVCMHVRLASDRKLFLNRVYGFKFKFLMCSKTMWSKHQHTVAFYYQIRKFFLAHVILSWLWRQFAVHLLCINSWFWSYFFPLNIIMLAVVTYFIEVICWSLHSKIHLLSIVMHLGVLAAYITRLEKSEWSYGLLESCDLALWWYRC